MNRTNKTTMALAASVLTLGLAAEGPERNAYFGDTHIHTAFSMDAFMAMGVRTTPDDAYDYAKGKAIPHTDGTMLQLSDAPLDFLMVSDHAEYLGVNRAQLDPTSPTHGHPDAELLTPASSSLADVLVSHPEVWQRRITS